MPDPTDRSESTRAPAQDGSSAPLQMVGDDAAVCVDGVCTWPPAANPTGPAPTTDAPTTYAATNQGSTATDAASSA
ncbi:hypothetical protein [Gordonia soli]|uniref:Uncharacterized protein n=1 Tax=Gordonia soli NBRC 108243 TaxID=1223545 RepID=M0QNG0_9ACTN|nr:hypothetical protein [Gordonia soli]GAC70108.1 hypothetical protein GS4_32_00520 [Gordonia soli NBRC 108243]